MRRFFRVGLVMIAVGLGGCWDFPAMRRESAAEFRREQEERLPLAREKGAGLAGLSAGDKGRVMGEMPEMRVEVEREFFPRVDVYAWRLGAGRVLKVAYERLEARDEVAWKVTMEGN